MGEERVVRKVEEKEVLPRGWKEEDQEVSLEGDQVEDQVVSLEEGQELLLVASWAEDQEADQAGGMEGVQEVKKVELHLEDLVGHLGARKVEDLVEVLVVMKVVLQMLAVGSELEEVRSLVEEGRMVGQLQEVASQRQLQVLELWQEQGQ